MADIAYLENKPRQGSLDSSSEKDISLEKSDTNGGIVEVDLDLDQTVSNAGGAPTEKVSALGTGNIGWFGVLALNINMMIGTGIFSTGGTLLASLGSPGLVLLFWVLGLAIALAGLAVYLELAHYFPGRAGAEVVYLEQAYRKPKYLFPATFAFQTVVLSFSSSNAIVLSTYLLYAAGNANPTEWLIRGVAVAGYSVASICVLVSTKWVMRLNNLLGVLKLIILIFVVVSGWVVLAGHTKVQNPTAAFHNAFDGSLRSGNGIANSIISVNFAFGGYYNALNVVNEIGGKDPMKTLRWTTPLAVIIVGILYMFATISYFAAVPLDQIKSSGTLVAALYFTAVFGARAGARILPALVAVSAFGNLVAVLIGQARIVREIGRQGVLPYPRVWTSTWPFGTPMLAIGFTWILTVIVTIAPPAGSAFNFTLDLQNYPSNIFGLLSFAGLLIIRYRRKRAGLPRPAFRAWTFALLFCIAISIILVVIPWVPPVGGIYAGDVSFFYATSSLVGIGFLVACGGFWYITIRLLPRLRGYHLVDETVTEPDGSSYNRLTKVWDDGRRS